MAYRRRLLTPLVAAALALTGCGHHGKTAAAPTGGTPTSTATTTASTPPASAPGSGTAMPTAPSSGSARPSASAGSGSHGSASPTASAPPPSITKIAVTLTLAHPCVSPGGSQTADVTTVPGALVVIDTRYSDNKDGQIHGGIKPDGKADAKGHFSYTWTVLPGTPSGKATTFAGAGASGGRGGSAQKDFRVATLC
jgi:hypothetical protein